MLRLALVKCSTISLVISLLFSCKLNEGDQLGESGLLAVEVDEYSCMCRATWSCDGRSGNVTSDSPIKSTLSKDDASNRCKTNLKSQLKAHCRQPTLTSFQAYDCRKTSRPATPRRANMYWCNGTCYFTEHGVSDRSENLPMSAREPTESDAWQKIETRCRDYCRSDLVSNCILRRDQGACTPYYLGQ